MKVQIEGVRPWHPRLAVLRMASLQSGLPLAFLGHGGSGAHLQANNVQFRGFFFLYYGSSPICPPSS